MYDSVIMCDEIIDAEAKSYNEETNLNEKMQPAKHKFVYFACIFINYYSIIDSCQFLLLSHKK